MKGFLVLLGLLVVQCTGQHLHVKHAPSYIVFQQQSSDTPVKSGDLHKVLAGPLGLEKSNPIIQSKSLLKKPKANVLITIATHKDQQLNFDALKIIPVDWTDSNVDVEHMMNNVESKFVAPVTLDIVSTPAYFNVKTATSMFQDLPSSLSSARERLIENNSFMVRIGKKLHTSPLNSSRSCDGDLLAEMKILDEVIAVLKKNSASLDTKAPDLLSFTLSGLKCVVDKYGVNSIEAREAKDIVIKHLNTVTEDLKAIYHDNVMVVLLTVPNVEGVQVRKTRSLMQAAEPSNQVDYSKLNLEIDWDQDFPAAFNIVLWIMIILAITVFFVAYGIWNMNPNLESILYRVPQDELAKKIN
ncbi:unnamed protein product [Lymnaea stagnalis]|uniref:Renin receptor n=1 Tax=Lymnaea stagnalis TaxID=6523 RepID=A0AAV2IN40_LYMST